jgi:hypothetical protein
MAAKGCIGGRHEVVRRKTGSRRAIMKTTKRLGMALALALAAMGTEGV